MVGDILGRVAVTSLHCKSTH